MMHVKKIAFTIDGALEVYKAGISVGPNSSPTNPVGTPGDTFMGGLMLMVSASMFLGGNQTTTVLSTQQALPMVWKMLEEMMVGAPADLREAMHLEVDDDPTTH